MYQFEKNAPLDFTVYPDPGVEDSSGPPLSQGFVLSLIDTVAGDYCSPEFLEGLEQVDPYAWYHGQTLETMLNYFEDQSPALVRDIGKNIYYTLQAAFVDMGMKSPEDVVTTLPKVWAYVVRGDSGYWKDLLLEDKHAIIEFGLPYNCIFEEGAFQGAIECFEAKNVVIKHTQCRREGAEACILDVTWE